MSLTKQTKRWIQGVCPTTSLKGKTVLITGANSGIGFKTAEIAVYLGADVILACRNPKKAAAARADLLKDYPESSVSVMEIDLSGFRSIDAFVAELTEKKTDIDVFINNAGAFHHPGEKTEDGLDLVIGTNYVGVYHLSEQILPYLNRLPHEVLYINTISVIHMAAKPIDYGDFFCARKHGNFHVYARSKLCLAKYTHALAERYAGTNIRVLMNHPGISLTPLGLNAYGKIVNRLSRVARHFFNSPEKSATSLVYILAHDLPAGSIVGPTGIMNCFGYPGRNRVLRKVSEGAEELIGFTNGVIESAARRGRDESDRSAI